ncbi:MAG TPA: hypothetical protein G4O00_13225 [Thermoflexia bacterium]|jgi:hypothetical protein|nr:hypothetical protein [Thermoflexia bacterium]
MPKKRRQDERPEAPSLAYRLGNQFTISLAIVLTDFGLSLMSRGEVETTWADIPVMVIHSLLIGVAVFLWLLAAVWLARKTGMKEGVAEGVMVLIFGLLGAGVEYGLIRGIERWAHTAALLIGVLAGWAMRIPPPESRKSK